MSDILRLAVNIGNTNTTVWGFEPKLHQIASFPTKSKHYRRITKGILAGIAAPSIRIFVASVVPAATRAWQARMHRQVKLLSARNAGIRVNYRPLSSLGADRVANAIAAKALAGNRACIAIDAGTAITVDAAHPTRGFLGGMILPGLDLSASAMSTLALLPGLPGPPSLSSPAAGKTTLEAMRSGALCSVSGGVMRAVKTLKARLKLERPVLIATGGDWKRLEKLVGLRCRHVPHLTIEGLKAWADGTI